MADKSDFNHGLAAEQWSSLIWIPIVNQTMIICAFLRVTLQYPLRAEENVNFPLTPLSARHVESRSGTPDTTGGTTLTDGHVTFTWHSGKSTASALFCSALPTASWWAKFLMQAMNAIFSKTVFPRAFPPPPPFLSFSLSFSFNLASDLSMKIATRAKTLTFESFWPRYKLLNVLLRTKRLNFSDL